MKTAEIQTVKDIMKFSRHKCFGKVFKGIDVIGKIRKGDKIEKIIIHEEEVLWHSK